MSRVLALCSLLVFLACEADPVIPPQGVTATITGEVQLYNRDGDSFESDRSGVHVKLLGTPFETVTDSTGEYRMEDIPPGVYQQQLTKDDFDTSLTTIRYPGVGYLFVPLINLNRYSTASVHLHSASIAIEDTGKRKKYFRITGRVDRYPVGEVVLLVGPNLSDPEGQQRVSFLRYSDSIDVRMYTDQWEYRFRDYPGNKDTFYFQASMHVYSREMQGMFLSNILAVAMK